MVAFPGICRNHAPGACIPDAEGSSYVHGEHRTPGSRDVTVEICISAVYHSTCTSSWKRDYTPLKMVSESHLHYPAGNLTLD